MSRPLQILIVEDSPADAELVLRELKRGGFEPEWKRVETEADFLANLRPELDLVLSDYSMPQFNGLRALELLKKSGLEIPFILISGTLGEEKAVEAMKEGAMDYFLKDRITRLRHAVESALEKKALREERKRLEQQLILQSTAVRTAGNAVLVTDRQGTILWVNPAFTTVTGYRAEEVVGKNPRILKAGMHSPAFYRGLWKSILSGKTWRGEFTNRRKDGSLFHDEHTITPIRNEGGEITHFVGVMHDVTERRRAEEELGMAHEELRHLLEHSPAVLYTLKVEGERIIPALVSDNISRLLGYASELCDYDWWETHLHPDDKERALRSIPETLQQGAFRGEYRIQHKDGQYLWVEDNRRLVSDAAGNPQEIVGVWTDITERKRIENVLTESERRLQEQAEMINQAREAIIVRDLQDRVSYWNKGAERTYGWTAEEVLNRDVSDFLYTDSEMYKEARTGIFLNGEWEGEIVKRTKDNRDIAVQVHWSLVRDAQGEPKAILSIDSDITEQKKMQSQFLRMQRMESIGTLASGIAHDLNNILAPIMMSAPLLRLEVGAEMRETIVSTIEKCAGRGAQVVKQVLTFGRGVEGERLPLRLGDLIGEMAQIMKETFPKDIQVESKAPANLWQVIGDSTQLHQVLLNLCVNARDAMPGGGVLRVQASNVEIDANYASMMLDVVPGHYIVLEVSDTGTGIRSEILDRIFDPFFTTKPVGKGTGLGLSTVLGIVKNHGGFMNVRSEPGTGTTFTIHLPANPEETPEGAATTATAKLPEGKGELVLVVDDEAAICDAARTVLEVHGYKALVANEGTEALALFAGHGADIAAVLTDLTMPVMDGVALARILRKMAPNVPIVVCSGQSDRERLAQLEPMNISGFLKKPYGADTLLIALDAALHPPAS